MENPSSDHLDKILKKDPALVPSSAGPQGLFACRLARPLSVNDQKNMDQLAAVFAEHGGSMTQDSFDTAFESLIFGQLAWSGADRIWGGRSGSNWACWLDLLQYAIRTKLAGVSGRLPTLVYHLPALGESV